MNNEIENATEQKNLLIGALFDFSEMLVISLCIVCLLFIGFFRLCRVDGGSMNYTLEDGQMLVVSDLFYKPAQGDIIVFHQTSQLESLNKPIVKRVIATPGQYVKVDAPNAKVYVSPDDLFTEDEALTEDYVYLSLEKFTYCYQSFGIYDSGCHVFHVPEGCLFVMGDNRNDSLDSRSESIGFVDTRRVMGKVILRLTPLQKFGKVEE